MSRGRRDRYDARDACFDTGPDASTIRKAVFPAAGLGTRFLPATKAQPKEMLPLVDKPIIQYGVEEAVASGVDNIILVTGRGKNAIEDHFDVSVELETFLEARGKKEQLAEIRKISNADQLLPTSARASRSASATPCSSRATLVGDEPFAVILGDDVIDAKPPALQQMIDVFDESGPGARDRARAAGATSAATASSTPSEIRAGRLPDPRHGREAAARGSAVGPRDHRPLHPDARHLPGARSHRRAIAPARSS